MRMVSPANLVLNRSFQAHVANLQHLSSDYRPLICDLSYRGRSATPYSETTTRTHEPRNPSVQNARAGWLAKGSATSRTNLDSAVLCQVPDIKWLFGFVSSPHGTSRQDRIREHELPSNALGGIRLPSAVESPIREKTQWPTPLP